MTLYRVRLKERADGPKQNIIVSAFNVLQQKIKSGKKKNEGILFSSEKVSGSGCDVLFSSYLGFCWFYVSATFSVSRSKPFCIINNAK